MLFRSYPVGEFGAFVKSIRTNNTEEPYIDGKLNSEYWEEVVSFDEISEAYFQKLKDLADAAADSAEEAAKSAEEAAKSASDLASLANRIIKFVPELPEVGEPDYIYAIVSNHPTVSCLCSRKWSRARPCLLGSAVRLC